MSTCIMSPVMSGPLLLTVSVTMIITSSGIVSGGFELLPGRVSHMPPQNVSESDAYPLKAATPVLTKPLIGLFFHHCEPQKFTMSPTACGSTSPMTNSGGGAGNVGVLLGLGVAEEVGVPVGLFVAVDVGVAVMVDVLVGVLVAVGTAVLVAVGTAVFVGVGVGVLVGAKVGVLVDVFVGVGVRVGVLVGVGVGVLVGEFVGIGVGVLVTVLVAVGVAVPVGVVVGEVVGVGVGVLVGAKVGVFVGVGAPLLVAVGTAVLVAAGTAVFVAVGTAVFVAVGTAVLVADGIGVLLGTGLEVLVGVFCGVAVGVEMLASYAPRSQLGPCGRVTPRWSVAGHCVSSAVSMAGLPASSTRVSVGPPLFASGPSSGSVFCKSPLAVNPQSVPDSMLEPSDSGSPIGSQFCGVPPLTMLLSKVLLMPMNVAAVPFGAVLLASVLYRKVYSVPRATIASGKVGSGELFPVNVLFSTSHGPVPSNHALPHPVAVLLLKVLAVIVPPVALPP